MTMEYDFGITSNRDAVAEKFVSSFLALQRGIAHTVGKGLSRSFQLDADLGKLQKEVYEILRKLSSGTLMDEEKAGFVSELNQILDQMCDEQIRTNHTWNQVDEQANRSLTETEDYWRRAESFFRGKTKRGDNRTSQPLDARVKSRKVPATNGIAKPPLTKPAGGEMLRPSLLPKRPNGTSIIRKTKSSTLLEIPRRQDSQQSQESQRSVSPDKVRQERRSKQTLTVNRKLEKKADIQIKTRDLREKEKEKKPNKAAAAAAKKRRAARASTRVPKKQIKDESDESVSEDSKESSDPSYQAPSEAGKARQNNGEREASRNGRNDSDEPRYCVCRNVSYGHMVGCDNDSCTIEWFHFVCVGLKAKPRGKWFCPDCRDGDNPKMSKNATQNDASVGPEK